MTLQGERLDRPTYSFLHTLDEGNTATCILAYHNIFNRNVVQKTVSLLAVPDGIANEPAVLKEVEHDRIVEVWEAQWDPDPAFKGMQAITFVCPYYEGGSIYTGLIELHSFRIRDAVKIADDVLRALDYLHTTKLLIHRDVKPANIMLDAERRRAFLGDLGSAVRVPTIGATAKAHGGSPLYQAPEASLLNSVTAKSDLYSLGMVLIEIINGRFHYEDLDGSQIRDRLRNGQRSLPDSKLEPGPWVPRALATFIRSLTAKDPSGPPKDAATALRTLRNIRFLDWARTSGSGRTGTWMGYWPSENVRSEQRIYEITAEPVNSGRRHGQLKASVRWRKPNGGWRNANRLTRYIEETDPALRTVFRSVEQFAQNSPAP